MEAAPKDMSWSIGEALNLLRSEFPDISISKIRFLESKGLIAPERTAAGFRRFLTQDISRLIAILKMQRDQYLPLKVIREHFGVQPESKASPKKSKGDHAMRPDQPSLGLESGEGSIEDTSNTSLKEIDGMVASLRERSTSTKSESVSLRIVSNQDQSPESDPSNLEARSRVDLEKPIGDAMTVKFDNHDRSGNPGHVGQSQSSSEAGDESTIGGANPQNQSKSGPDNRAKSSTSGQGFDQTTKEPNNATVSVASSPLIRRSRRSAGEVQSDVSQDDVAAPEGTICARDFQRETGANAGFLSELEQFGIIRSQKQQGAVFYGNCYLELVKIAKTLDSIGLSPRHLKAFRVSVEKEFGLIEQLVATQLRPGGSRSKGRAREAARALEEQTEKFRSVLLGLLVSELVGD